MDEGKRKIVAKKKNEEDLPQRTLVVKELPMEPVRQITENGVVYNLVTVEEMLTDIANQ